MTDITLDYEQAPPAEQAPAAPAPDASHPFTFTGKAGEYFGIWIVNLFLTLVTLGVYSAWAKVRKKRYLYGSTWLAGSNFEYHGNPVAILKGRLIAVAAFVAYTLATQFSPKLGALLFLAMVPAVPWLVVRSMAFNAANSSYRHLRFRFEATYRQALAGLWPIFVVAALGLLAPDIQPGGELRMSDVWRLWLAPAVLMMAYPYMVARIKLLQVNHSSYGTAPFACDVPVGWFYAVYIKSMVLLAFAGAVGIASVALIGTLVGWAAVVVLPLAYFFVAAAMLAYTRVRVANKVFNATTLAGSHRLVSTLSARTLAKLYATNLLAITLTVGLAVPWAVIRTARYRAECLALRGPDLDAFLAALVRDVAATGEEVGEMFDIDLSL
jgi:uncharacterized membrane protein YjgN (DUF898 family)